MSDTPPQGNNYNLSDPDWYSVTYVIPQDVPTATYFVRVFALDANGNYLGFGSSATSANLTNNNAQNFFKVQGYNAFGSSTMRGSSIPDIQAGAIGCSIMTVTLGTSYFLWEYIKNKRDAARRPAPTDVVTDVTEKAAVDVAST